MSITELLIALPPQIPYVGYIFSLQVRAPFVGYYLTQCTSNNKKKRAAYKQGIWVEHRKIPVSTVNSNYLFIEVLFDDTDLSLQEALQNLFNLLLKERVILPLKAP